MGSRSLWTRASLCKQMILTMGTYTEQSVKYAAYYCWRSSGRERAMAMYFALLEYGAQDNGLVWRTDEIGK